MSPNTLGQEAEKTGGKVIYLRRQSDISVWAREGMLEAVLNLSPKAHTKTDTSSQEKLFGEIQNSFLLFEGIYLSFSQRKSVHLLPI